MRPHALAFAVLLLAAVVAADFDDADNFDDPTEKAIMTCSDAHRKILNEVIPNGTKGKQVMIALAKGCCDVAVEMLRDGVPHLETAEGMEVCFASLPVWNSKPEITNVFDKLKTCVQKSLA